LHWRVSEQITELGGINVCLGTKIGRATERRSVSHQSILQIATGLPQVVGT
jgi:hypothetical protein